MLIKHDFRSRQTRSKTPDSPPHKKLKYTHEDYDDSGFVDLQSELDGLLRDDDLDDVSPEGFIPPLNLPIVLAPSSLVSNR